MISTNKKTQSGFTLLEMAIVMIIASLILIAMVNTYLKLSDMLKTATTKEHLSIVNDAMSAYASRNFRVPCPANPAGTGPETFGFEKGSFDLVLGDGAVIDATQCDGANAAQATEGIIPFQTLGIDAEVARDGWGNFLTYQVSPVFTQDMYGDPAPFPPAAVPAPAPPLIHAKCRTTDWIEGISTIDIGAGVLQLQGGRNTALQKARFCCIQPAGTESQVYATPAPAVNSPSLIFVPDIIPVGWYDYANFVSDPNDIADPVSGGVSQTFYNNRVYGGGIGNFGHTDMVVYALISHGKNEAGAYLVNGTNNRQPLSIGLSEIVNANPVNQNIYDIPHDSSSDNTFYDDIVSWQTQSNLMARLNRDSCATP